VIICGTPWKRRLALSESGALQGATDRVTRRVVRSDGETPTLTADRARSGHGGRFSIVVFHERNMMSNKPHLRPHEKGRRASRITRLLVAILIIAIFALAIALEMTGRVVFRGRLILSIGPVGC